ncbi:MAG: ABC transporter permease [Flavobacteriales bacterium]|nr:ABC transporter permease [Flavobacteriales bacterium]
MYGFLVLFGVITVIFFLFHTKPGDPARMLGGQNVNEEIIKSIRHDLGLDLPLYKQYLLYLNDLSPISINSSNEESHLYWDTTKYSGTELVSLGGDKVLTLKLPHFRRSYRSKQKVADIIMESLPGTIVLAASAIVFATFIGIILGIFSALYKGSFFDSFSLVVAVLGMSGPSHFMAIIIAWIGGYLWYEVTWIPQLPMYFLVAGLIVGVAFNKYSTRKQVAKNFSWQFLFESGLKGFGLGILGWLVGLGINGIMGYEWLPLINSYFGLPGTGLETNGSLYEVDNLTGNEYLKLSNLILPALTLGIRPLAIVLQLTRSSMLDVMSQDYIRTATAKGLSKYTVVAKHALKNALNPVITAISGWFASLLAGAVFVENIFNWNGIGKKVFDSVVNDDFPVVVGSVLIIATMFVIINIMVDIIYGILDPRIRLK